VNVAGSRSPPVVPGPEDVPVVIEKDFADFRILRLESCEMINSVSKASCGREKANQSDDVDASEGV
jgi:hypothetical protein